jgi:lipid-binding SYLF domain-containing protein
MKMKIQKNIPLLILSFILMIMFLATEIAVFAASEEPLEIIRETAEVLEEMDNALDSGMFRSVLKRAKGVAIFPSLTEIALLGVGGFRGNGLVLRKDFETGNWYGPAFLKISALGVGAKIGIQNVDLVLVINDSDGLEAFMKKTFKFGGTLAWTVGPIGRSVSAEVDSDLTAPIFSYSITKGLYFDAGSLQGSTIKDYDSANENFWGVTISNRTILNERIVNNRDVLKICDYIEKLGD